MEKGLFFTGFPGFICNQLIREVLKKNDFQGRVFVLVLPGLAEKAQKEREAILSETGLNKENFDIIEGDITIPGLMIPPESKDKLAEAVTHVYHLAAIYDLAVARDIAYKVNVSGTKNVNDWVKQLPHIRRYTYFSTGYVVGKREGTFLETELIRPKEGFKNFYEETKFEAELSVEELKKVVPVTIIRPGIVRGHSETGETIKFDGPYFIMNFLERLKFLPILPRLGKGEGFVNLVPVDFIIQATTYLSFIEKGAGKTYHLTDPNPYRASEIYEMMMDALINKRPKGSIPLTLGKWFLAVKPVRKYLGVEKESLDYFSWMGKFDCSQTINDLNGSGIKCPDLKDGIRAMTSFYLKQKDNPGYQITIL